MNEDLKYRKAEPADAERIMEIIRQAQAQMRALITQAMQLAAQIARTMAAMEDATAAQQRALSA